MDENIRSLEEKSSSLLAELETWILKREETITEIKNVLAEMAEYNKNVKIASITGGSVSLAGSAVSIVGAFMLFSPFAPVGLLIGGGVAAGVGGVTSAAANITHLIIEKLKRDGTKGKIENDAEQMKRIVEKMEEINELYKKLQEEIPDDTLRRQAVNKLPSSVKHLLQLGFSGFTGIKAGLKIFKFSGTVQVFTTTGKTLGYSTKLVAGKIGLGAIGVVLSAVEIGYNAHGLIKKTKSVTEEHLEEWLSKLQEELEYFKEFKKSLSDSEK